jgi:hypothetical protein
MTTNSNISAGIRHDLFAAISYGNRSGAKGAVTGIDLDGHFVYRWLVRETWDRISASVITASPYKFYTAKELFDDPERWAVLETPFRIAVGRCLAYFVRKKMLPLECANPGMTNKIYTVIAR